MVSLVPCPPRGIYERSSSANSQKLRCLLHYFARVVTTAPQGAVSFERKVLPLPSRPPSPFMLTGAGRQAGQTGRQQQEQQPNPTQHNPSLTHGQTPGMGQTTAAAAAAAAGQQHHHSASSNPPPQLPQQSLQDGRGVGQGGSGGRSDEAGAVGGEEAEEQVSSVVGRMVGGRTSWRGGEGAEAAEAGSEAEIVTARGFRGEGGGQAIQGADVGGHREGVRQSEARPAGGPSSHNGAAAPEAGSMAARGGRQGAALRAAEEGGEAQRLRDGEAGRDRPGQRESQQEDPTRVLHGGSGSGGGADGGPTARVLSLSQGGVPFLPSAGFWATSDRGLCKFEVSPRRRWQAGWQASRQPSLNTSCLCLY